MSQHLNEEGVERFLRKIGLRKYEIQAYIALIKHGPQEYTGLIKLSGVPYGKIYTTMGTLAQKGWVKASKDRPRIFHPVDPERPLKNHLKRIRENIRELEEAYAQISPQLRALKETFEEGEKTHTRKNLPKNKGNGNQKNSSATPS